MAIAKKDIGNIGIQGDKFQVTIKIDGEMFVFWTAKASSFKKICKDLAKKYPSTRIDSIEYWGRDPHYPDCIDYNYCSESNRNSMLKLSNWYEEFNYLLEENGEWLDQKGF